MTNAATCPNFGGKRTASDDLSGLGYRPTSERSTRADGAENGAELAKALLEAVTEMADRGAFSRLGEAVARILRDVEEVAGDLDALTARPNGEMGQDALAAAYIAGATEVHDYWKKCRPDVVFESEPDFTEAASDYAKHEAAYTPSPTTNAGGERDIARLREALENAQRDAGHAADALACRRYREGYNLVSGAQDRIRAALATKGGAE